MQQDCVHFGDDVYQKYPLLRIWDSHQAAIGGVFGQRDVEFPHSADLPAAGQRPISIVQPMIFGFQFRALVKGGNLRTHLFHTEQARQGCPVGRFPAQAFGQFFTASSSRYLRYCSASSDSWKTVFPNSSKRFIRSSAASTENGSSLPSSSWIPSHPFRIWAAIA